MDRNQAIAKLIAYALEKQLIQPEEKSWLDTIADAISGLLS